ncbi:MAG: NUDIX hydrolase domain-like protein [Monoraphidium minutum]|nr:MAG: NUDIX hydrolase domain-like protein [Monoraphidium minutum]
MAVCRLGQAPHLPEDGGARLLAAAWEAAPAHAPAPIAAPLMATSVGGPTPTCSRQGRDKQRYTEDGARLVAGCIPFRRRPAPGGGGVDALEVLLVTSRGGKGWGFPKGGWEDDETVESAALRETVEEAGVRGRLEHPPIGVFAFQSDKHAAAHSAHQGRCVARMFAMAVGEELETWPEHPRRQRRWMSLPEASACCRHQWMRDALHAYAASQGWQLPAAPAAPPGAPPSPAPACASVPGKGHGAA